MKLKIRYENEYQTIELDEQATNDLWVSLSIDEDEEALSQEDKEQKIQEHFEEKFNRPEYNSWHKHDRHTGVAKMRNKEGEVEVNTEEAVMTKAVDPSIYTKDFEP